MQTIYCGTRAVGDRANQFLCTKISVQLTQTATMTLKLYQFQPCWGIPNASPFCMKLETYLRMTGRDFENCAGNQYLQKAPKDKLPFIEDQGKVIADSSLIIEYLKATYHDNLDEHLSPYERGAAKGMQRLFEDHLYWVVLYIRWVEYWPQIKSLYFSDFPPLVKDAIATLARRRTLANLNGHGMGRHSRDEIYGMGRQDIDAIAHFLSGKPYFMGDQPTSLDATAYSFLVNILDVPIESELKTYAQGFENLRAYCDRMKAQFYQDL